MLPSRFFPGAHNFLINESQFVQDNSTTINNYHPTTPSRCLAPQYEETDFFVGKDIKQKLREELKFVENAGIDDDKICLPDTRREIIKDITKWVQLKDDNTSRTYILCGEAGTGKSAIAHAVGKELQEQQLLVVFFAFNRSLLESRTPSNALRTIAYNLGVGDNDFAEGLFQAFEGDPTISGSTNEPRDRLLSVLMSGKRDVPSNFRVFATSRLENDVIVYVDKFIKRDSSAKVQKMTDIKGTDEDIYRFVVKKMTSQGGGLGILEESQVLPMASTVCKELRGGGKGGLSVQIRFQDFMATAPGSIKTLTPLDKLYMIILEECFDDEAMERYQDVMGLVLSVFEPLSRTSLKRIQIMCPQHQSRNRDGERRDTTIDAVVCFLGSLFAGVDMLDTPVRPVHTSIRDFLLDEGQSGKFAINTSQGHTTLVWGSLHLMIKDLHFNMCNLKSSYVFNSEVRDMKEMIAKGIPLELEYASCFWDEHLSQIEVDKSVVTLLEEFWYRSSLFWLEVLSVLQRIHVVSRAIENVRKFIGSGDKVCKLGVLRRLFLADHNSFKTLLNETQQFVRVFGQAITDSTPHLYLSAIPFIPKESILQQVY
ncbi:hypothetical protein BDP27DRAFT_1333503, partial [Rhodocollybia butyracea]